MKRSILALVGVLVMTSSSIVMGQDEVGPHYEHLKNLEYFVGNWKIDGKMETDFEALASVTEGRLKRRISYQWMSGKNFLSFAIKQKPKSPVEYMGVIGWDPEKKQIRSRDFNSQGAWFEYVHIKRDDGWVIEGTSVYPGGAKGTYRAEITIIDEDTFRHEGGGVMVQDGKEIKVSLNYDAKRIKPREKNK